MSIDTLRADHLSCYGYPRQTSPNIDALAQESLLFETVVATSSSTGPSHMSMFTGTLPRVHGIFNGRPALLGAKVPYVPELLAAAGYRTAAFADGGILTEPFGFAQGFGLFESRYEAFPSKLDRIEEWLEEAPDEPTFLFVHTYAVHAPYLPDPAHDVFTDPSYGGPLRTIVANLRRRLGLAEQAARAQRLLGADAVAGELGERVSRGGLAEMQSAFWGALDQPTPADAQHLVDLYDGCIRGVDAGLARLFGALQAKGWLDDGWLLLTSDHGEAFGEHGHWSHRHLSQGELLVPLLVRPPGGTTGRRIETRVSLLDLGPTLLGLAGLAVPAEMQGRSLLPFDGLPHEPDRRAYATEGDLREEAVFDGAHKLVEKSRGGVSLYDVEADRRGLQSLEPMTDTVPVVAELRRLLLQMRHDAGALQKRLGEPRIDGEPLGPERLEELRALGYIR